MHAAFGGRPNPSEIQKRYEIDDALTMPAPTFISIVDDLLTTPAHFRAARVVLGAQFPTAAIVGLFVAPRVPDAV